MRLKFRLGDGIAVAVVCVLAAVVAFLFFPRTDTPGQVEIYQYGKLVRTENLHADGQYELSGAYTNLVAISNGQVSFLRSDCPGQDCVHSGAISATGRSLVCLPNGVEVRIVAKSSDVDFAVG